MHPEASVVFLPSAFLSDPNFILSSFFQSDVSGKHF